METAFDQQSLTALMVGASAKLDALWELFTLLHFGVFTLLLLHRNKAGLTGSGKAIALAGYLVMLGINFGALSGTYRNLDGLQQQFRKDFGNAPTKFVPTLRQSFVEADFSNRQMWLYGTHGGALLIVIIVIFGARFLVNEDDEEATL
ncbi:MAG: hypothetical protein AB7E80_01625 [Hyphomicrobiaceae bacterium]